MPDSTRRAILFVMEFVFSALWALCFVRGYKFYVYTLSELALEGSANAAADFRFSQHILFCYAVSFVIGFAIVWLAYRLRQPLFGFSAGGAFFIVAIVVFSRSERVIVLLPDLVPYIALLASLVLATINAITAAVIAYKRRFRTLA